MPAHFKKNNVVNNFTTQGDNSCDSDDETCSEGYDQEKIPKENCLDFTPKRHIHLLALLQQANSLGKGHHNINQIHSRPKQTQVLSHDEMTGNVLLEEGWSC
ncbi:flavonol sulfotransferase-like protein [Sesbania bispinosa]|nr:flavonol sulfotransferase-like protein [Sesbania bispinosa]